MIVTCTACQTKFRVPDEKIGEKAVKVRCSKCQNLFAVKRGAGGNAEAVSAAPKPPEPAPAAAPADPFAAFGPPPAPGRPGEVTTPGVWHGGIAASKRASDFEETKPGVALGALVASKLASGALPPPLTETPLVAPQKHLLSPEPQPVTVRAPNPLNAAPSSDDIFANLGPQAAPDPFANLELGVAKTMAPVVPQSQHVDPFAGLALHGPGPAAPEPAADPFAGLALGSLPSVPAAPAPAAPPPLPSARPASVPPAPAADPFADLAAPAPAAQPPADPFAHLDLAAAPAPAPAADPFANLDLSAKPAAPPAPAADPFAHLDLGAVSAPASPEPSGVSFSFESGAAAPEGSGDEFFGGAHPALGAPATPAASDEGDTGAPDRSMFDLPAAPPPAPAPAAAPAAAPSPAPPRPSTPSKARPPTTIRTIPRKPVGPRVIAALLNALFVVAVGWVSLLTYATSRNDWHFDAALLRPAELGHAVFGSGTAASQLALEDVASGSYEISGGRAVFFVRGELVNRGKSPVGPAKAHVELLEGDDVVAHAEAWANAQPVTPEQVYNLGGTKQLDALVAEQGAKAQPLEPGESRPFVAVMLNVPESKQPRSVRIVPDLGAPAK